MPFRRPLTFVALAALGVALAGCRGSEAPPPAERVVLVQPAAPAPVSHAVFNGEVRARHEIDLAFRVGGKIAARLVDAGASINAGQALARLDPADLQLAANAAQAQLSAAESDYATARSERERQAGLLARKFVSQAAFEAKDNAYNAAKGRLAQSRAQSEISANQSSYGTLSSVHVGIITAVLAEAGQVVAAGQPVMRLARPEEKEVAIAVPESRVAELRAAKQIAIQIWAQPDTLLRGTLRELSPAADASTRTYAARIRIIDAPPSLGLGMTARVLLDATPVQQLLVPLSAVIDAGHGPLVRVVQDGKVASRPVSIARFREDGAEIASGLQVGEAVVVTGAGRLVDGEAVQTRPVTPPERQR
ncbi:efflux RND transporter periplasmic adaptor subunit [Dechloromonas sp.]|uniref:efflux RND transporter periplasmic adaptor subunit n=1 Tax=Dechloromonas sp. TaxID=1917218 RepID=UPI00263F8454|nr:efflux RND transporter periplasmic adaptor subunit [Dechloromonas sp.]